MFRLFSSDNIGMITYKSVLTVLHQNAAENPPHEVSVSL